FTQFLRPFHLTRPSARIWSFRGGYTGSALHSRANDLFPLLARKVLWLSVGKRPAVHGPAPAEPHVQAALSKEPMSFFRTVVAGLVGVEQDGYPSVGQVLGPAFDL